jgi:hypothetical protein
LSVYEDIDDDDSSDEEVKDDFQDTENNSEKVVN